ncbi:hypothetical protein [Paenibacillus sp. QZ-Y1]|uniref:hypothetical protein n=1 Tax=Paenibacillus sp. QZ-Y1 TaxID=3414511 RepID=UPI003F79235A
MKLASVLGIVLLAAAIIYGEWQSSKQKRARIVVAGISIVAAVLALLLLFPSQDCQVRLNLSNFYLVI